jgi:hypothetical protein
LDVNGSFVSATENNKRRVFSDPNVPIGTRKKGKNNPDRNQMDHEENSSDEIDEPIPLATAAESNVDSSGKSSLSSCVSYRLYS